MQQQADLADILTGALLDTSNLQPRTMEYYGVIIGRLVATSRKAALARYEVETAKHGLDLARAEADGRYRQTREEGNKKLTETAIEALCTLDSHVQGWRDTLIQKQLHLAEAEADSVGLEIGIKFELELLRHTAYEDHVS